MSDKSTDQMYMEDQLDAITRVLDAPMPVIGSWERVYSDRINLVREIIAGTVHPGDVQMAPLGSIDQQVSAAFGALGAALK